MHKLKHMMAAVVLTAAWGGVADAAGPLPEPENRTLSPPAVLDIHQSLPGAPVTISGPCIAPSECVGGPQDDRNRVLATVTVSPSEHARAALSVDMAGDNNESSWATGFLAVGTAATGGTLPVMISLSGGTPPGAADWWVAGEPGQPVTWTIRLKDRDWVREGVYDLTLYGASWSS